MRYFKYLDTFLLLAKLKNYQQVAQQRNLTPTAISKQIKLLEAEIAEQLFVRTTRKVELTEFGQLFLEHCTELADKANELEHFIAAKQGLPSGKLSIVCSLMLGKQLLLQHLPEFSERYPNITFDIEFTENTVGHDIEKGDVHFGFAQDPVHTDIMHYKKLLTIHHVLCATPAYLAKHPPIKSYMDLLSHQLLTLSYRQPKTQFKLSDGSTVQLPTPHIVTNSFASLMECCLADQGVLLTGDLSAKNELASGALVSILPELNFRAFEIFIFYRALKYEVPKIRAFVDFYADKLIKK